MGKRIAVGDKVELMVVERDPRCKFITIHPETAETTPALLKHVNRTRDGFAGGLRGGHQGRAGQGRRRGSRWWTEGGGPAGIHSIAGVSRHG